MVKVPGQRVSFRAPARIGAIAASLAAAAALLLPSSALASTAQLGSLSGAVTQFCPSGIDVVQSMSAGASYSVPSGGTSITGWSIQAGPADQGTAALEVWRPTAIATDYQLVGMSSPQTLIPGALINVDLSASPIPVNSGDLIGLHVEGSVLSCATITGNGSADVISFGFGPTVAVGGTETLGQNGWALELDVIANVNVTDVPNPVPTSAKQCKGGGWQHQTDTAGTPFKNQGDCVSFVATQGANLAG